MRHCFKAVSCYTNTSAAYAALCPPTRLLDAARYVGPMCLLPAKAATDALMAGMAAIRSAPSPMGKGYFGTTEATDGYTDVLCGPGLCYSGETSADSYRSIGYVNFKIASTAPTVLLKNGDSNPGLPGGCGEQKDREQKRFLQPKDNLRQNCLCCVSEQ